MAWCSQVNGTNVLGAKAKLSDMKPYYISLCWVFFALLKIQVCHTRLIFNYLIFTCEIFCRGLGLTNSGKSSPSKRRKRCRHRCPFSCVTSISMNHIFLFMRHLVMDYIAGNIKAPCREIPWNQRDGSISKTGQHPFLSFWIKASMKKCLLKIAATKIFPVLSW